MSVIEAKVKQGWKLQCVYVLTDFSLCFRTLTLASTVCRQACKSSYDNCHYMLFTNKIGVISDLLIQRLTVSYCTEMFI